MFFTRVSGSVVAAASLLFAGGTSFADTICVPDDYDTIQGALDAALDGDEICVRPGTYNEAIDFLGKAVRLYGTDGPEVTVIDATGLDTSVVQCVSSEQADTILQGFTITGGSVTGLEERYGGGMYNRGSSPTVTNCTFIGNRAERLGGGMYNADGSPTVTNCTFRWNAARSGEGGGMYNAVGSNPTVTNCTFSRNEAFHGDGGGMFNAVGSNPTVTNCTFIRNTAEAFGGGGMENGDGSNPTVTNCTFIGNTAGVVGGGMHNYNSNPTVTNCTFIGNTATLAGGGMYNSRSSRPMVANSIFWDNDVGAIDGATATVTYSDVQGGYDGIGNIDADPRCDADGRPQAGSPGIDAGNNDAVPGDITTDLDGNPRFVNDPDTEDTGHGDPPIVDMGAYELQGASCPADLDDSGVVDVLDVLIILAAWGDAGGREDLDASGVVDYGDVLVVLGAWGSCPG